VSGLIVASVQDSIDRGRVVEEPGRARHATACKPRPCSTRSPTQRFDAAIGGARRDEERARAKERMFSFRDDFGHWDPKHQRPELWNLYNTRIRLGEHVARVPAVELDRT
jgi:sulfate adenylyltransferase subunit 2